MADQVLLNIQFVKEIHKHPCLYNYTLPDSQRKDIKENAWTEVGKVVNLSNEQCKIKWRNLRAVFTRHLKMKKLDKKPYYLAEEMDFVLPFVRLKSTTTNVKTEGAQDDEDDIDETDGEDGAQESEGLKNGSDSFEPEPKKFKTELQRSRKMFLLSLLPDIYSMNEMQMRVFRIKVLNSLSEILDNK